MAGFAAPLRICTLVCWSSLLISQATVAAGTLDEIVVTAQAREETLKEVPISLTVISGEHIERTATTSLESLSYTVPNFTVSHEPFGDKINIRGIFTGELASLEQSVSTFLDGVNHSRGAQARFSFLDLERIEILRGPQGTLFGKNTVGGVLNLTSRKPTDNFAAHLKLSYETELEATETSGFISGPLTESVRGRFAFKTLDQQQGWVDNHFYNEDVPVEEDWSVRGSMDWDLTDSTLLRLRVDHGEFDRVGQAFGLRAAGNLEPLLNNVYGFSGGDLTQTANGQALNSPLDLGTNGKTNGDYDEIAVTLIQQLGDGQLESVLAYSAFEFSRYCDCDFGPLTLLGFDDREDFQQSSFSLRYLSPPSDSEFSYVVGLYYQNADMLVEGLTSLDTTTANALTSGGCSLNGTEELEVFGALNNLLNGIPLNGSEVALINSLGSATAINTCITAGATTAFAAPLSRVSGIDQDTESTAIYGQGMWPLTDKLHLTAGIRYTRETKSARQYVYRSAFSTNIPESIIPGDLDLIVLFEAYPHLFTPDQLHREETNVTYSASLEYALTENINTYWSASTGFKAGGFNIAAFGPDPADADFEEENVFTTEVGFKSFILDDRLELNAAVFYTEIDDLQVTQFTGSTTFIVQNAARAEITGFELDGRWQLTESLGVNGALSYIDFEFKEFPLAGCTEQQLVNFREAGYAAGTAQVVGGDATAGATTRLASAAATLQQCSEAGINDMAGRTSEQVPEFTVQLGLDHTYRHTSGYTLYSLLETVWMDEQYRQTDLDPISQSDAFSKTNVAFTLSHDDKPWALSLIVRNAFNERTFSFVNDTPLSSGTHHQVIDKPRQVFMQLMIDF